MLLTEIITGYCSIQVYQRLLREYTVRQALLSPAFGLNADALNTPSDVTLDSSGVYIADSMNNRVLYYSGVSTTATRVYGQLGNFTCGVVNNNGSCGTGGATASANSLNDVGAVIYSQTRGGLFVADRVNNRVLFFPGTSTTATQVWGQAGSFVTTAVNMGAGPTAGSLNLVSGLGFSPQGLIVADTSNNRVLLFGLQ